MCAASKRDRAGTAKLYPRKCNEGKNINRICGEQLVEGEDGKMRKYVSRVMLHKEPGLDERHRGT